MTKIIILLLCCGVLIGMVGCGSNTAPPPTETPPTMVSEKQKEETKPTLTTKPTEPSAAENGCITIVETDVPPKEEIKIPPKSSADLVAQTDSGTARDIGRMLVAPSTHIWQSA